jgi:hypothetical protein
MRIILGDYQYVFKGTRFLNYRYKPLTRKWRKTEEPGDGFEMMAINNSYLTVNLEKFG